MQPVTIIRQEAQSALIEWVDGEDNYHRAFVPTKEIVDGAVKAPEKGMPYGEDWAKLIKARVTPALVDRELKRSGIYTIEDLLQRLDVAQGAINRAVSLLYSDLLSNAQREQGKRREEAEEGE